MMMSNGKPYNLEFNENVSSLIRARYPYIWIQTQEEQRILKLIQNVAREVNRESFIWDDMQLWNPLSTWTNGDVMFDDDLPPCFSAKNILEAFQIDIMNILEEDESYLLVFPDFHFLFQDGSFDIGQKLIRLIKWFYPKIQASGSTLIFISNTRVIPSEIRDIMHVEMVKPPAREEILEVYNATLQNVPKKIVIPEAIREKLISSALGLNIDQAERLFSLAISKNHAHPTKMVDVVVEGKKGIIASSGALEFFAPNEVPCYLAGLEFLKEWLELRRNAFGEEAQKFYLPKPQGVFLMGIPGTGKSLTAKYIAGTWKMPLLRFDMAAVFGSYVGQTEETMRHALSVVEAIAPAILWIDEIEKAISTGPDLDSGVSQRVLGTLLTWMQENTEPVFVVATANDTTRLPPELMRKGRFDELFFLDLPNFEERRAIFEVHIERFKRIPDTFNIDDLAKRTDGYVGAEIEQIVKEALYIAFNDGKRDIKNKDLITAIKKTKPLSKTKESQIKELRSMVDSQEVVLASKPIKSKKTRQPKNIELI